MFHEELESLDGVWLVIFSNGEVVAREEDWKSLCSDLVVRLCEAVVPIDVFRDV